MPEQPRHARRRRQRPPGVQGRRTTRRPTGCTTSSRRSSTTSGMAEHHVLRQELLHAHEHPDRRGRAPGRHVPVRHRPRDVGARRELQGARARQPVRRRHELLPEHRGGEPGAHGDGERDPRRRAPARAHRRRRARMATATEIAGRLRRRAGAGHRAGHVPGRERRSSRARRTTTCRARSTARCSCRRSSLAIAASLLGRRARDALRRRSGSTSSGSPPTSSSMTLLVVSWPFADNTAVAYPLLLVATAFLGAGFGLHGPGAEHVHGARSTRTARTERCSC